VATNNKYLKGDLPIAISVNIPTALVRYERQDFAADYAIGNTPWISAASDNNRISRLTTQYQKERIDQASSAGENSLSNWWLRGATSWHHGMGERYYDADTSDLYRYFESNNVDIWDLGEAKLLKKMNQYSNTYPAKTPATTTNGTFYIANNLVWFYNAATNTAASVSLGSGVVPHVLTTDGGQALVGASNGIYEVTEALVVTKYWNSSTTTWTVQAIAYVKDRIMACVKTTASTDMMKVLELDRNPAGVPKNVVNSNIAWTYATADLTFNSIAAFPGAIAVAYTLGAVSRVQAYTLTPGSLLAGLDDPYIIAELPRGEILNQIRCYLNEYVVLATTEGIRVGNLGTDGISFTYGSINVEGDCKDIAFNQSYIYGTRGLAVSGTYGAWRIDLGTTLLSTYGYTSTATGYAYAPDVTTDGNIPTGISFLGSTERKIITSASGVWIEDATVLARSGYIKSGWIRFGTSEKKQPVSLSVRSSLPVANSNAYLGFNLYDQEGHSVDIGSIPIGMTTEIYLAGTLQPADHFEVTFNFNTGSDTAVAGPVLEQWTLRGLPAPLRSRTFTVPLLCYEDERDSNGVSRTSKPYDRLKYLETIEQNGGAVLFQDFSTGEERICVIRAIQYEQAAPPTFARGFGGIVTLQLQTIDHEDALQ
jgi:hypothetical protein